MKDFSLPPYDLGEIGDAVKRLGEILGVHCDLCAVANLKNQGYYSLPTLSIDIARMAIEYGISMEPTDDLGQTGVLLQTLIDTLRRNGFMVSV